MGVVAIAFFIMVFMGGLAWLRSGSDAPVKSAGVERPAEGDNKPRSAVQASYEVVNSYPHDPTAFLQGLVWYDGVFYESTGLEGKSTLRRVEFPSGKVLKQVRLDPELFGEGLALVNDRLIQLTWTTGKGFVYDRESFNKLAEFTYDTEGWGLAYDGQNLILSDGSNVLTYLDPQTFKPVKKLSVTMNGRPARQLNELEFIEGEIWANVWQTDRILRIDPASGQVTSYLDLRDLLPPQMRRGGEDVLNGIAYDHAQKRIFVSGKLWPRLFEIRLK
ncbi:MAG TPA: glutaminyl-peptide cyclotransferase [Blastocatellia bacterium]|jgi:glutamine cyclotransferase|nr:glutaminyl-peptide cyclotransferase [Blastocatellia bacterium]